MAGDSELESEEAYGRLTVVGSSHCPSRATKKRSPGSARERAAQAARQHDLAGRGWLPIGESPRRLERPESSCSWRVAMLFNRGGKAIVSSILLIVVIDLGCGLMLLTSPMGLDVANLPVFDVLIVSELIAVSLLPAVSVFPIALGNSLFILGAIALQPHTPGLNQLLASGMAYDVVVQPIGLQIIVAAVTYLWVRSALRAIARSDRAKEVAELQRRDAERTHQLETGIQQLLQTQVRAANGDLIARANLSQDNVLWQVGVSLNMLLPRLQKAGREASRAEYENQQLRGEVARLTESMREARADRHIVP